MFCRATQAGKMTIIRGEILNLFLLRISHVVGGDGQVEQLKDCQAPVVACQLLFRLKSENMTSLHTTTTRHYYLCFVYIHGVGSRVS